MGHHKGFHKYKPIKNTICGSHCHCALLDLWVIYPVELVALFLSLKKRCL